MRDRLRAPPAGAKPGGMNGEARFDEAFAGLGAAARRVLLIESDPVTARGLTLILATEGFEVETAEFGAVGVTLAMQDDAFDLIVIGTALADMPGFEARDRLVSARIRTPMFYLSVAPSAGEGGALLNVAACG
jgi:DNA-binding response OmpR family regulator